jgi:alkanesulfonate monooxygenase SsuD/methylene tetrahydromethanopterin reductase-like flavin-dependent oxidoreductase (luciferase family)
MQLGLMTEPQLGGTYDDLLRLAQWSEDVGLDAFARSDHYLDGTRSAPATDALATLAGLARETARIQLVVLVTPLTFRHPAVIAKTAATIDEMSGGRFALGIGTGWMESEHDVFGMELPEMWERFSRLFEVLAYVQAAHTSDGGFRGRHYELKPIEVLPRPARPIPVIVGGNGRKKTPTYAGRFADEYNLFACDRENLEKRVSVMRAAAEAIDRDPDDIIVSFSSPTFVAPTEDAYRSLLEREAAGRGISTAEFEDGLIRNNYVHGIPDQAASVAADIAALGVGRLYLQEFRALADIDTDVLGSLVHAIRT